MLTELYCLVNNIKRQYITMFAKAIPRICWPDCRIKFNIRSIVTLSSGPQHNCYILSSIFSIIFLLIQLPFVLLYTMLTYSVAFCFTIHHSYSFSCLLLYYTPFLLIQLSFVILYTMLTHSVAFCFTIHHSY